MIKSISYRMDAMYITLSPQSSNFKKEFEKRGYELREPEEGEAVRVQRGYKPENALMLDIQIGERDDEIFTLTVQTRMEQNECQSAFIAISGEQLDYIPYEDIIRTYRDWVKCTRADIAADIIYSSQKELDDAQLKLCKRVGFNPKRNGFKHSKKNDIIGGNMNIKKPISTASLTASNGLTLYVGGRQSRFMVRAYDKSAEVLAKTGEVIEPTLRVELETKREIANGVVKELINSDEMGHELAPTLWHTVSNDYIKFKNNYKKKGDKKETLSEVVRMDKAKVIKLDYSEIEGKTLEYEQWVRSQVTPKFREIYGHKGLDRKIKMLSRVGFISPLEMETILTALVQAEEMENVVT